MNIEAVSFPNLMPDERAFRVVETGQLASVRLARSTGAAVSMFGVTACAFAIEPDGKPTLTAEGHTIEGHHTASCPKADLIVDGQLSTAKVDALRQMATEGAITAMLSVLTVEQALTHLDI
jgi:hypothetical protein